MDAQKIETTPYWLLSLAAGALALAWWVTRPPAETPRRISVATPERRPAQSLRWTQHRLPPLRPATAPGEPATPLAYAPRVAVPMPRVSGPSLVASPTFADLASVVSPGDGLAPTSRFVVLKPSEPRLRAGERWHKRVASRPRSIRKLATVIRDVDWRTAATATGQRVARNHFGLAYDAAVAYTLTTPAFDTQQWFAGVAARLDELSNTPRPRIVSALPSISEYLQAGADGGVYPKVARIGMLLDRLSRDKQAAGWAWATAYRLRTLVATTPTETRSRQATLTALKSAADDAAMLAEATPSPRTATELRRARYAIERRLSSWQAADAAAGAARAELAKRLEKVRWAMRGDGPPIAAIGGNQIDEIRLAQQLADELEAYEKQPTGPRGRRIAIASQRFASASTAEGAQLAATINENYRNANIRFALSSELIERLLPTPEPTRSPVRDRIAGAPVRGQSVTRTKLGVALIPDEQAWRLGLEARGVVSSDTVSDGGAARLRSRGETNFVARKLIVVGANGVSAAPAVASARAQSRLMGISSSYDSVPLVGSYIRSTARDRYGMARRRATGQVQVRVEKQVRKALDTRTAPAIDRLEQRYANSVVERAAALGLDVTPLEMRTTEKRIISRVRLANSEQLGSHTPRMRAPSNSLLSFQLHESAVNNTIEGLGLSNAKLTATELRERIRDRLQVEESETPEEEERAVFWFAKNDPVRVRFVDGRVQMTMAINEMVVAGRRHRAFKVHTFYRPESTGLKPTLVQDGTPQIEGRMRTASRLHLHGVLGKMLGESRRITLERALKPEVAEKLQGISTSQFVIEDGWLGWAIAPEQASVAYLQIGTYVR